VVLVLLDDFDDMAAHGCDLCNEGTSFSCAQQNDLHGFLSG
jgi:hypothetical protein